MTQELAERFGVSHTPIREALISLSAMGIIDLLPNRGAVVRKVSRQEVREVCQVRRVLECEATRLACGRMPLADLEAIALSNEPGQSRGWQLVRWTVHTGTAQGSMPTASVELTAPDGSAICEAAVGDGPVHALCHALSRATGIALELDSYQVQSVTTGEDAQGQATLSAYFHGEELTGSGTSTDILEATAMAWLDMANRCLRARNARRIPATESVADAGAPVAA